MTTTTFSLADTQAQANASVRANLAKKTASTSHDYKTVLKVSGLALAVGITALGASALASSTTGAALLASATQIYTVGLSESYANYQAHGSIYPPPPPPIPEPIPEPIVEEASNLLYYVAGGVASAGLVAAAATNARVKGAVKSLYARLTQK